MVSPHLKNISQNGNLPQIGVNIKNMLKPPPGQGSNTVWALPKHQFTNKEFVKLTGLPEYNHESIIEGESQGLGNIMLIGS